MADRERIVEVAAARIRLIEGRIPDSREVADLILAALEAAGYAWYRPEDCARYWMVPGNNRIECHRGHLWADQGPERNGELSLAMREGRWVRVVPVGGDS